MTSASARRSLKISYVGGPTALIEIGGLRILTDPTFDPPGTYDIAPGRQMTKLVGPAVDPENLGKIDFVLLSHDHHLDNLDRAGRAMLSDVPHVLTTIAGSARLGGNALPTARWSEREFPLEEGGSLTVIGVPAQHGPDGTDHLTGEVTGFVLRGAELPAVYVSGDNASLRVVKEIRDRLGLIDVALLFAGAARTGLVPGENLTLSSSDAAEAARMLEVSSAYMLHFEGWAHFTEGRQQLRDAFELAGLSAMLRLPDPRTAIDVVR